MTSLEGVDSDERKGGEYLGRVGEGETIIRIYCMETIYFQWKVEKQWTENSNIVLKEQQSFKYACNLFIIMANLILWF